LAGSTSKKVLVFRFDRETIPGFVNPPAFAGPDGIELLSTGGVFSSIPMNEVKMVCFVKEFDGGEAARDRRLFTTRPKMEGLWIRMHFRDGEFMDGMLANNLLALEPYGFTVTPPDPSANNQRVFVPRTALRSMQVMGVVGSPLRRRRPKVAAKDQLKMFE
jgi:hypothetical protein